MTTIISTIMTITAIPAPIPMYTVLSASLVPELKNNNNDINKLKHILIVGDGVGIDVDCVTSFILVTTIYNVNVCSYK